MSVLKQAGVGLVLAMGLLSVTLGSGRGPAPATAAAHKSPPPVLNPHLHITPPASPAPHPAAAGSAHPQVTGTITVHSSPSLLLKQPITRPAFDNHTVVASHRSTGTIRGEVVNPSSLPVNDARVALRKPGGRIFKIVARRHITFTASNGTFTMTNVAPGTYRVFASQAKLHGFTKVAVHAGSNEHVIVKI